MHATSKQLAVLVNPNDQVLDGCGALAQLGERNTGSVEVSGSIPLGSTNFYKFGL